MAISSIHITGIVGLAPPFALDGSDYIPPGTSEDDFVTALRNFLISQDALSGLSGIYFSKAVVGAEYPYMVFNRLWQRTVVLTRADTYKEAAYQFTVLAMDAFECDAIGQAAYDSLLPIANAEAILFAEGYEMTRSPGQSRGPDAQNVGLVGGDPVWQFSFDYTFLLGKNS